MHTEDALRALLASNGLELTHYCVGAGGSASVHRGRAVKGNQLDLEDNHEVAIKEYNDTVLKKPEQLERIQQEVVVGKAVQHPNVVRIHGLVSAPDIAPLVVMDWVAGVPLDQWRRSDGDRTWSEVQEVALGLTRGLAALHQAQVRHRDVKPANIFITEPNHAILMDMGVVQVASDDETTLHTSVNDFIGSVRYASPQFIQGEDFELADDVYALGATLYFAVTGREVFDSVQRKPLLPHRILTERLRVGELTSGFPSQLAVLIEGAMHPSRSRRPSVGEIEEFLLDPTSASYIQRELDAKNREERGFRVVGIFDKGATVIADLRGAEPRATRFAVVRELPPIRVPSLGGEVKPEKWVADVELKHWHNSVGHFAVQGKRWEQGKPGSLTTFATLSQQIAGTPGQWVEYDKQTDVVRVGDVVVEVHE